jgi:acyl-CoA thioesterase-1
MRNPFIKYALLTTVLACSQDGSARTDSGASAQASEATNDARRTPTNDARRTLLFVGTSLTAGYGLDPDSAYPQLIQRMIDSAGLAYQVINAGVSGETSSSLLRRMDWLLRQSFDMVVIETGANDGLRGIPIETMQSNIQLIVERVRAARPSARVVLVQMEAPPNLGRSYTQRFRAVFPELAARNEVALLPFILDGVAGRRELNQGDGIHPNMAGERIVARNVWKGLRPLMQ